MKTNAKYWFLIGFLVAWTMANIMHGMRWRNLKHEVWSGLTCTNPATGQLGWVTYTNVAFTP